MSLTFPGAQQIGTRPSIFASGAVGISIDPRMVSWPPAGGSPPDPPPPPSGYAYLVNGDDAYILNGDGAYILAKV